MVRKSSPLWRILKENRHALATTLLRSTQNWEKYHASIGTVAAQEEFIRRELAVFVDYLVLYFQKGDEAYRDLYIGEKLKQCYDAHDSPEQALERRKRITRSDNAIFRSLLLDQLSPPQLEQFKALIDSIHEVVTSFGNLQCKVLLVGDCLHLDLLSFLTAPLAARGISLVPTFITTKNFAALQNAIRDLSEGSFDLVFFSPFSYEFHVDYTQLHNARSAYIQRANIETAVEAAKSETVSLVRLLAGLFECPIFVHNSANILRHNRSLKQRAKNLLTYRTRRLARESINGWLPACVASINAASCPHVHVLDEAALLRRYSEHQLGGLFYGSELQHPAEFGRVVAKLYEEIVLTHMLLSRKKLVVCDLDNTLWRGVIGEGAVEHYSDRQQILKSLKGKGLLLAINSKNDPRNVRWDGAVLEFDDFVAAEINWDSKLTNIRRIASRLNLKTKDVLFIDDRADEREMISSALPEILSLDAESPLVWSRLDLLSRLLPGQQDGDRTLMYKQREQRERFLEADDQQSDHNESFSRLDLKVSVRFADRRELKRITELINRTNQFNLCGSRTSLREVAAWHADRDYRIFVVDANDKFGAMGTVSVLVARRVTVNGHSITIEIPVFVLSCRVFGYGMETVLLNCVKHWCRLMNTTTPVEIKGLFRETPHNEPCRRAYSDNGFLWEGSSWVFRQGSAIPDPAWLSVERLAIS